MIIENRTRKQKPAGNTGFASGGVTCKLGALCYYSSSVQVDSEVLRNRQLRQHANRCKTWYEDNNYCLLIE